MDLKMQIKTEGKKSKESILNTNDTILINFSRSLNDDCYIISFVNDCNYSKLSYEFFSNQIIDCYFKYHKTSGKTFYSGYSQLSKKDVDISDCIDFSIIIPREKNTEICEALTLVSLFAK